MIATAKAEIYKTWTTTAWWGLLLVALGFTFFTVLIPPIFLFVNGSGVEGDVRQLLTNPVVGRASLPMAFLGTIIGAVDFRHRTITWALLATPRRGVLFAGKAMATIAWAVALAVIVQLIALGLLAWVLGVNGEAPATDPAFWGAFALGIVDTVVWGLLGLLLGLLFRNQIGALLLVIAFWLVDSLLTDVLPLLGDRWGIDWPGLLRFSFSGASNALRQSGLEQESPEATTGFVLADVLPAGLGLLVLVGYLAVVFAIAWFVSLRRDVS